MRQILLLIVAVSVLFLALPSLAQQAEPGGESSPHHVSFSFDPVHGVMQGSPVAPFVIPGKQEAATPSTTTAAATYTGTIDITVTVKLISTLPKDTTLRCSGSVGLEVITTEQITPNLGLGTGSFLNNQESVNATISGSTATCKFSLPYSWAVPASTSKSTVTVSGITGSVGIAATATETTGSIPTNIVVRSTSASLIGPATIPADGSTTTLTASTVL
jgi:hypothetical protein